MAGPRRRRLSTPPPPVRRRGVVRVATDVARRLRAGHPWVFRDAVRAGTALRTGDEVEVVDPDGEPIGRGLFDADGVVAVRIHARDGRRLDGALLADRLGAAFRLRRALLALAEVSAWRLCNGEADGVPGATCDVYGEFAVVCLYSAAWERHEAALLDAVQTALAPHGVYLQRRYRPVAPGEPRPGAELARGRAAPVEVEVREGDLRFAVDVTAPLSPGLFADLREARREARALAAGRRVLNLFSYTGAISLAAAAGGAALVTGVDVAARAHARARRNFALSGLDPERHEFLTGDAEKTLARLGARGRRYDLAVIDPPPFGGGRGFAGPGGYADLVAATLAVLDADGLLLCASNARRLPASEFDQALAEGAARAGAGLRIVRRIPQPPDFPALAALPESAHLKCVLAART